MNTIIYVCGLDRISVLKFCVDPQIQPKCLICLKITKPSISYFIMFCVLFSLPLQTECVASSQPLTFTYFHRKYLSFSCFTAIHQLFLNRTKMFTFSPKQLRHTNSLYNCCNGVYLICWSIAYSLIQKTCI